MLIDTNIILRYLTGDDDIQSPKAKDIITYNQLTIKIEVLFEVVHVLEKVYKVSRPAIRDILNILLKKQNIHTDSCKCVTSALDCYVDNNIDFVDALLWAYHVTGGEEVVTFDKKLNRLLAQT